MFSLREFLKKGFIGAVGHMADYQIILNASGWMDKGVLTEDDLAEINTAIEQQYVMPESPTETQVEPTVELTENETMGWQYADEPKWD